jgi:hypothetical protein
MSYITVPNRPSDLPNRNSHAYNEWNSKVHMVVKIKHILGLSTEQMSTLMHAPAHTVRAIAREAGISRA